MRVTEKHCPVLQGLQRRGITFKNTTLNCEECQMNGQCQGQREACWYNHLESLFQQGLTVWQVGQWDRIKRLGQWANAYGSDPETQRYCDCLAVHAAEVVEGEPLGDQDERIQALEKDQRESFWDHCPHICGADDAYIERAQADALYIHETICEIGARYGKLPVKQEEDEEE